MNAVSASLSDPSDAAEVQILREREQDAVAVEALVMAAFGPGRFAKTAERVRERAGLVVGFTVFEGEALLGSVRLWSVSAGRAKGVSLGPIAVAKSNRSGGLGGKLVERCIEEARALGTDGILLIGDPPYFERFGFVPAPKAMFAGPVNPRRVMWLPFTDVASDGIVKPLAL